MSNYNVIQDQMYRGNGVVDGETGLLVSGESGSWESALTRLIENPILIESIRQKARLYIEKHYNVGEVGRMWMENVQSLPPHQALTDAEKTLVQNTKWSFSFSGVLKPETPCVANLLNLLRKFLPIHWKIFLLDTVLALKKRLHF
jgi:hypothetical protein